VSKDKLLRRVGLLGVALLCGLVGTTLGEAAEQPNVIVILTDDQGYGDLSCYGAEDLRTPHIDQLAADGVRCTAGYVTAPQCAPSRAGLLMGLSQNRFGFLNNSNFQNPALPQEEIAPTIGEVMQSAGYATGAIGKWHIGHVKHMKNKADVESFADQQRVCLPWNRGFDYGLIHSGGGSHYFPYSKGGKKWMTSRNREYRLAEKTETAIKPRYLENLPASTYLTDYFSKRATDFIERHDDEPFFLYLAYNAPHLPLMAKDSDLAANAHIDDKYRRNVAAMMTAVDRGVGKIRQKLASLDLTDQTLIVYLSDNGGPHKNVYDGAWSNDPWRGFKGDMLEGGIRVPFIVTWPGELDGGQTFDKPVTSLDLLPTAAANAGVSLDEQLPYPGVNLIPYLQRTKDGPPREQLYWQWGGNLVLRDGALKLIANASKSENGLYNLEENPEEKQDRQLQETTLQSRMRHNLQQWKQQSLNSIPVKE
jgi:arylsulfatase B